jgi:integrase
MPKVRPRYLHREVSRHGKVCWYFRRGSGQRIRLPGQYGSVEFEEAYARALGGSLQPPMPKSSSTRSLAWLVDQYRQASAWTSLAAATRRQRESILAPILRENGFLPFAKIDRKAIVDGRDRRGSRPAAARHFVDTMRGLFRWALDAELVHTDPTATVTVRKVRTDGHHVWTDQELARFEAKWPLGTRERLAFDLLVFTGLRRGDAACLGRQHVRDGQIVLKTQKTGETVVIPVLPALQESITAFEKINGTQAMAFVATRSGTPLTKEAFGNWFRKACNAAELPHCSAHGLRKASATRAANNGATVAQLEALFGWRGGGMASLYTRKADRERLGKEAAAKLVRGRK